VNRLKGRGPVAVALSRPGVMVLKGAVRTYQLTLRGIIGSHCRFYPHCSAYAIEALETHGAARGSLLAATRLLRCHPWHPGGYDPVPLPTPTPGAEEANPNCPPQSRPGEAAAHQKA
jgi:putative membrane protein insertion efficiency factor